MFFSEANGPLWWATDYMILNELCWKSYFCVGFVWYCPLHIIRYSALKWIRLSKIPIWTIIAHYILPTSLPFAFIWQQNPSISDNICIEDRAFGHRPLRFFVTDIISHSPKPYSHTPWKYANNVLGLLLYCRTWTTWLRGTPLLLELLSYSMSL